MKTVLAATDFSMASRFAMVYAREFAKATNAKMILFNAYTIPSPAPALGVSISRYDIMMQTDKRLLDEADFLDPQHAMIEVLSDEGSPTEMIKNIAKEKQVDLVIVGMKGTGKNLKKIFGTTAAELAGNCSIPVLIVPEKASFKQPNTIVLASDNISQEIPKYLKEIMQLFQSKLYIVQVIRNEKIFIDEKEKIISTGAESITTLKYYVDSDVTRGLDEFIKMHNGDMLAMTPHKHEWLERIFIKSETKEMIFHTHIPLLVLPQQFEKINITGNT